ncbi:hypothetical protein RND81_10G023300 [Saponaria officinalis]|uniref:Uncharacterized protein n=1 Tax=Saponaria officinalis TaxID=3572 RepID=A0AAW1HZY9_SAPOF
MFNFVRRTLIPRKENRAQLTINDMMVLHKLLLHDIVNLVKLVFEHIKHVSQLVVKGKTKDQCLPYGMWLSHLFKIHNVVSEGSVGLKPNDKMVDGILGQMSLVIDDGVLMTNSRKDLMKTREGQSSIPKTEPMGGSPSKISGSGPSTLFGEDGRIIRDISTILKAFVIESRSVFSELT